MTETIIEYQITSLYFDNEQRETEEKAEERKQEQIKELIDTGEFDECKGLLQDEIKIEPIERDVEVYNRHFSGNRAVYNG